MRTVNSTFSSFFPSPLSLQTYFPSEYLPPFLSSRNPAHFCSQLPSLATLFTPHSTPCRRCVCWIQHLLLQIPFLLLHTACAREGQCCPLGPGWVPQSLVGGERRRWGSLPPLPKASAPLWWPYLQLQFSLQAMVIIKPLPLQAGHPFR